MQNIQHEALAILEQTVDSQYKTNLKQLVDFVINRSK
jgi:hypothetical protein